MAVVTKDLVMERTVEAPKTFKVADTLPIGQEYHYLHRVVGVAALPDGTLDSHLLDEAVMEWTIGKGYRIQDVSYLGQHKGDDGNVHGYVYGFHLVKG